MICYEMKLINLHYDSRAGIARLGAREELVHSGTAVDSLQKIAKTAKEVHITAPTKLGVSRRAARGNDNAERPRALRRRPRQGR